MRKQFLVTGMIAITACAAAAAGCTEKKEGPQTIIIELADPSDVEESSMAEESEASTEAGNESEEASSVAEEVATDDVTGYPQIEGLSDNVTLSYTQIGSDDPIIGMVIADILPEIHAKDLDITNIQAYMDDEEIVPYGDVTFSMNVDPDAQVVLYKLDENGKITSEKMEVTDGAVSYQTSKCGRWIVISSNLESETEAETVTVEAETETVHE